MIYNVIFFNPVKSESFIRLKALVLFTQWTTSKMYSIIIIKLISYFCIDIQPLINSLYLYNRPIETKHTTPCQICDQHSIILNNCFLISLLWQLSLFDRFLIVYVLFREVQLNHVADPSYTFLKNETFSCLTCFVCVWHESGKKTLAVDGGRLFTTHFYRVVQTPSYRIPYHGSHPPEGFIKKWRPESDFPPTGWLWLCSWTSPWC